MSLTIDGMWSVETAGVSWVLSPGWLAVAQARDEYICRHSPARANRNLVLELLLEALDDDVWPLFEKRVLYVPSVISMMLRLPSVEGEEEFISLAYEIFDCASRASGVLCSASLRLQRIKRYIEHHCCDPITLRDLAAIAGVSPFTCLRKFKEGFGETPFSYLARCRLRHSEQLLARTRLPLEVIAAKSGFSAVSYFCRFFKKHNGVTPSEFRRLIATVKFRSP